MLEGDVNLLPQPESGMEGDKLVFIGSGVSLPDSMDAEAIAVMLSGTEARESE